MILRFAAQQRRVDTSASARGSSSAAKSREIRAASLLAVAVALCAALPLVALAESPAVSMSGTATTVTYSYTGAAQAFVVPAGVTSLQITATGAEGGGGGQFPGAAYRVAQRGGAGAAASDQVSVTAGTAYTVEVGGVGVGGSPGEPAKGGYNGGGSAGPGGGGGGGASDVCLKPLRTVGGPGECLVVAGGGGGAGGNGNSDVGGQGGTSEHAGTSGEDHVGAPGAPGTASAGGAGGGSGSAGQLGSGGAGGDGLRSSGGGGGGGLYGGGGGAAGENDLSGGGGGGGSRYVPGGSIQHAAFPQRGPQVVISYFVATPPSAALRSIAPVTGGEVAKTPPVPNVRLANTALAASDRGVVSIKVTCPADESTCIGTVTVRTLNAVSVSASGHQTRTHKPAVLTLAAASFRVAGGHAAIVRLHLTARARALLARAHVLRVRTTIVAHDPTGATHTTHTVARLRAPEATHSHGMV
jgi:hypothetical protein